MSSLIDRQAAIGVASKECYELRGVFGRIEEGLNELPTAEAIPIKWLKEWERKYNEKLPIEYRGETVIKEILKDWEKENETI